MDYEKEYKDALERAKNINDEHQAQPFDVMTKVFPELRESEDERIRKRILLSLEKDLVATKNSGCNIKDLEECITWLEKQGEQKSTWSEEDGRMCNSSIRACQYMVEHFENSTKDYEDSIDWLKSIKERMK